jgi:hypothetical protein
MCLNVIRCTKSLVGLVAGLDDMEYLSSTGIFPRTIQPRSESLYRLRYPDPARPSIQKYGPQLCVAHVDWCTPSSLVFRFCLLNTRF